MVGMSRIDQPRLILVREHPATLGRLDRDAGLQRIRSGAYMRREEWAALTPWERYRARVLAVARTWRDPVFCLESAAVLHGLPVFGEPRDIHLLDDARRSWRASDVVVHATPQTVPLAVRAGSPLTTIADTATDLARVLPPAFGLAVADAATRLQRTADGAFDISAQGRAQTNRRGVRRLDWIQERIDGRSESVGESVSRAVIEWLGYDEPEPQVVFTVEGFVDRVDFFWNRSKVIGESDGWGKYDVSKPDEAERILTREKVREDRLRRHVDGFARWEWVDAMRPDRLDAKLRAAGLRPVAPRQPAMLATLIRNPRSLP